MLQEKYNLNLIWDSRKKKDFLLSPVEVPNLQTVTLQLH